MITDYDLIRWRACWSEEKCKRVMTAIRPEGWTPLEFVDACLNYDRRNEASRWECLWVILRPDVMGKSFYLVIADFLSEYCNEGTATEVCRKLRDKGKGRRISMSWLRTMSARTEREHLELVGEDGYDLACPATYAADTAMLLLTPDMRWDRRVHYAFRVCNILAAGETIKAGKVPTPLNERSLADPHEAEVWDNMLRKCREYLAKDIK